MARLTQYEATVKPARSIERFFLQHWTTALDNSDENDNDRQHQKEMNKPAKGVGTYHSECPQQKQDYGNCPKHGETPFALAHRVGCGTTTENRPVQPTLKSMTSSSDKNQVTAVTSAIRSRRTGAASRGGTKGVRFIGRRVDHRRKRRKRLRA